MLFVARYRAILVVWSIIQAILSHCALLSAVPRSCHGVAPAVDVLLWTVGPVLIARTRLDLEEKES